MTQQKWKMLVLSFIKMKKKIKKETDSRQNWFGHQSLLDY